MKIYIYIFLAIILSLNYKAYSQNNNNKLEIINSNITIYDSSKNPDFRRLVDSVIFKHDNAIMKCDSAWHYFKKNEFQAFGNIHINHGDSITLTGEYLHYIGSKNKLIITRNINLKDNNIFLKTNELHYNLKNKIASYYNGGNIITEKNNIYSLKSDYYTKSKIKSYEIDVTSRNLYPPRVKDMNSRVNILHSYGWEESGFPDEWVADFNTYLQGITVMSSQVKKILIDNGVKIPIKVSGLGLNHIDHIKQDTNFNLHAKKYKILHISPLPSKVSSYIFYIFVTESIRWLR